MILLLSCASPDLRSPVDLVVLADRRVAVHQGRIVSVDDQTTTDGLPTDAHTVVLRADRVTAGFVDAHAHPDGLGRVMAELDLVGLPSYAATLDRLAAAAEGDGWVVGRGWDQEDWPDAPPGGWPLAADLEARLPGRPVHLRRVDGHASWVSPAVLRERGIDATTPDPPGGRILRDANGQPTGVLIDAASDLVRPPDPDPVELRRQLQSALVLIAASGLTGVHAMGVTDAAVALMEDLDRAGRLPVRLWVYVNPDTAAAERLAREGPRGGDRLRIVGVKVYADGALGSRGALLSTPYTDEPGTAGLALATADGIAEIATAQLATGSQVAVHAIGDLAVTRALEGFARARAAHPERASVPLRVEHAQIIHPKDVARFRELNVVASLQPTHATSDAPWAERRLGPERIGWAYAWRTLVDAGALVAFGSDFPVEAVDPALGISAAVGRGGWRMDQAVSLDEAIAGFTVGAARAVQQDDVLGTLAPGKLADLTLWAVGPEGNFASLHTVVGGEVVASAR